MWKFFNMLRLQLSRVFNPYLFISVLLCLFFALEGALGQIIQNLWTAGVAGDVLFCYSFQVCIDQAFLRGVFLLSSIPFVLTLVQEQRSGAARYYMLRGGTVRYTVSKMIASYLSGFLLAFLTASIAILILNGFVPDKAFSPLVSDGLGHVPPDGSFNNYSTARTAYELLWWQGHYFLGALFMCVHVGLIGGVASSLAGCFACWFPNRLYVVCTPYIILQVITMYIPRMFQALGNISYAPSYWVNPLSWAGYLLESSSGGRWDLTTPFWQHWAPWIELAVMLTISLGYSLLFTGLAVYRMNRKYNHA